MVKEYTSHTPTEERLRELQSQSDKLGEFLTQFGVWSWDENDIAPLVEARNKFHDRLIEARELGTKYFGKLGAMVGLTARYFYDNEQADINPGSPGKWKVQRPQRYFYGVAYIQGEYYGISPVLVRNPSTKRVGWRLCAFFTAFSVMGLEYSPSSQHRAKIAVPLGEIHNPPVAAENDKDEAG